MDGWQTYIHAANAVLVKEIVKDKVTQQTKVKDKPSPVRFLSSPTYRVHLSGAKAVRALVLKLGFAA